MGSPKRRNRIRTSKTLRSRTPSGEPPPLSPESLRRRHDPRRSKTRSRSCIRRVRSRTPPRSRSHSKSTRNLSTPVRQTRVHKRRRRSLSSRSFTPLYRSRDKCSKSRYRQRYDKRRYSSSSSDRSDGYRRYKSRSGISSSSTMPNDRSQTKKAKLKYNDSKSSTARNNNDSENISIGPSSEVTLL